MNQKRFTLMELLVVTIIITIATSMLLPVLSRALEKGRATACFGNMKQMGLAMADYTDVYDEYMFPPLMPEPVGHWLNYMYVDSFDKNESLAQCPSLSLDDMFNPYGGSGEYGELTHASYIMNIIHEDGVNGWSSLPADITTSYWQSYGWMAGTVTHPVTLRAVSNPAGKVCITDSAPGLNNTLAAFGINRMTESDHGYQDPNFDGETGAGERQVGWQHGGKFNVLFGDTHVELRAGTNHEEWNVHQM